MLSQPGRRVEAVPLRRLELTWCRGQNGDTDPGTLASINALAIDLRETGKLEEALTYSQQALERLDLARVLQKLERNAGATALLQELMRTIGEP